MEKDISFPADDGKTIYATLNTSDKKKCRGLIIYAHGLPSNRNDYTYLQSARMFAKIGYDTLRISFYDWQENARNLKDCSFAEHVADLETAIQKYKKKYKKIYLIGHSWGGPTVMLTDCSDVSSVSLWDPSYNIPFWWHKCTRIEGKKVYLTDATDVLISPRLNREAMFLTMDRCRELSASFLKPIQVLHAKKDAILYKWKESYHSYTTAQNDYHLIKDANHSFLDEDAMKLAVQLTHKWFSKF